MKKLYSAILAVMLLLLGCETPPTQYDAVDSSAPDAGIMARPTAPGEEGETAGNNLSFPVIWSEGITMDLRGSMLESTFSDAAGDYFNKNDDTWYLQGIAANEWQAENTVAASQVIISGVDWGDNLEAKAWRAGAKVRVETVLYKDLETTMEGYTMLIQDENVSGVGEVWGTNGVTYESYQATIYSGSARLVIQKLTNGPDEPVDVTWDPVQARWNGTISDPFFNGPVWESVEGPGGYSAEINIQGKVIYGYNWDTKATADGPGIYRLTFAIDGTNGPDLGSGLLTLFDDDTYVIEPIEEELLTILAEEGDDEGGTDLGGGTAQMQPGDNLSYIDVMLTAGNSGGTGGDGKGRPDGRGGPGNGSGGHNGGSGHHGGNGN